MTEDLLAFLIGFAAAYLALELLRTWWHIKRLGE